MDKSLSILHNLLTKLTLQYKVNFVRFPLIIMWLSAPLALYGYIITKNMLLYWTFIGLILFNLVVSIVTYYIISRLNTKELKTMFETLDNALKNLKELCTDLFQATLSKKENQNVMSLAKKETLKDKKKR